MWRIGMLLAISSGIWGDPIRGQINYHDDAIERSQRARKRLTKSVVVLFGAVIVAALLHGFTAVPGDRWRHVLVFAALALPGFGAALVGIRDQRQYLLHEQRSRRIRRRLRRLSRELRQQDDIEEVQKVAREAQLALIAETLDWSSIVEVQHLEIAL